MFRLRCLPEFIHFLALRRKNDKFVFTLFKIETFNKISCEKLFFCEFSMKFYIFFYPQRGGISLQSPLCCGPDYDTIKFSLVRQIGFHKSLFLTQDHRKHAILAPRQPCQSALQANSFAVRRSPHLRQKFLAMALSRRRLYYKFRRTNF